MSSSNWKVDANGFETITNNYPILPATINAPESIRRYGFCLNLTIASPVFWRYRISAKFHIAFGLQARHG